MFQHVVYPNWSHFFDFKHTKMTFLKISFKAHDNTSKKMDSNASFDWPHAPNSNRTSKYLYFEGNVSYVDFYLHQPSVAAVFIVSYLLIFLLCMVGNGAVCFIVLRSKRMRTVTNLFILNLAVSDLLVGIFCMPTTLLDNIIAGRLVRTAGQKELEGDSPAFLGAGLPREPETILKVSSNRNDPIKAGCT